MSRAVSFVITLNYFIQFLRRSTLLFKDATGTFYNDRWKPLFEGLLNVVLSISFVVLFSKFFGEEFGVVGVIVATIITNLAICHIIEPYVLYKHAFHSSVKKHYIKNYTYIAIFTVALTVLHFCMRSFDKPLTELLVNGCISIAISVVVILATVVFDKDFRHYFKVFAQKLSRKILKT